MADEILALKAWRELLESEDSRVEANVQRFLEQNPALLPGAHTLDTNSGHPPWPHAVVSQPRLPSLSTKVPDFMWIASDSVFLYPVLIEIETPWKHWYHSSTLKQHSDVTNALDQIAHWRRWFSNGRNHDAFADYYRLPRSLQDLTLRPRYVIVIGRRAEANARRLQQSGSAANSPQQKT